MPEREGDATLTRERVAGARQPFTRATTLPAQAFTSPALYEREVERLFSREWLCAGRADQVPKPGDYYTLDLLGDKLVIVRDRDEEIRVLSRVCRHRAAALVEGAGNTRSFQCPYHAWTYGLDGKLVGAPHMDGAEGFDRSTCRLPQLRSELWEGWIFVNFDADAAPLGAKLEPLSKLLANYRMSEMVSLETATFDSPFNWKVLVDNFMEAYHHIATHRDTLQPLFPAALSNTPDNEGPYSVLYMPSEPAHSSGADDAMGGLPLVGPLGEQEQSQLVAAVVYPFHLFAPSANSLTWYQILPETFDHFTLRIFSCFPRAALDDTAVQESVQGLQAFTKIVHHQDIAACEATFAGLGARSFESGPLAPLEKAIWQFNQWWTERMTDPA
jgi:phenylpropionate dioxygenase-like ring-hydroxylating dioxygenase large terminal subunit